MFLVAELLTLLAICLAVVHLIDYAIGAVSGVDFVLVTYCVVELVSPFKQKPVRIMQQLETTVCKILIVIYRSLPLKIAW